MTDEEIPPILPQPSSGFPVSQNLEIIEYQTKIHPFEFDEEKKKLGLEDDIIDGHFPPDMIKYFWGYIIPDHVMSNLREYQVKSLIEQLKASRKLYLKTIPPRKLTFERIRQLDNLEAMIMSRLMRGLDGFYTKQQTMQTQQVIYGQAQTQPQKTGGFIGKISNTLFGGGMR